MLGRSRGMLQQIGWPGAVRLRGIRLDVTAANRDVITGMRHVAQFQYRDNVIPFHSGEVNDSV